MGKRLNEKMKRNLIYLSNYEPGKRQCEEGKKFKGKTEDFMKNWEVICILKESENSKIRPLKIFLVPHNFKYK